MRADDRHDDREGVGPYRGLLIRLAVMRGQTPREMSETVDAAEVSELLEYDRRRGLPDRWLETLTVAAVAIANSLGGRIKLPPEQHAAPPTKTKAQLIETLKATAARLNPRKYGHLLDGTHTTDQR